MIRRQPDWQQEGCVLGHRQCFCHKAKPRPDLLQWVTMHVARAVSNVLTPLETSATISALAVSKAVCNSSFQAYTAFFDKSSRKGCMSAFFENAKATCSINPNQLLMPVISAGQGNSFIALSVSWDGCTPSSVNQNLRYSICLRPQANFAGFWVMP